MCSKWTNNNNTNDDQCLTHSVSQFGLSDLFISTMFYSLCLRYSVQRCVRLWNMESFGRQMKRQIFEDRVPFLHAILV